MNITTVRVRPPFDPQVTNILEQVAKLPDKPRYKDDMFIAYLAEISTEALTRIATQATEDQIE